MPHPDFPAALTELRAGRLDQAITRFRAILAVAPEDAVSLHHLGLALHQTGAAADAQVALARAQALDPDNADQLRNLGAIAREAGRNDAAADLLTRACERNPADAHAHALLCDICFRLGRTDAAQAAGQRALTLRDQAARARSDLAPVTAAPPPFDPRARKRNVIAYSLFGPDPYYHEGAVLNARMAPYLYPEWSVRIYADRSVPDTVIKALVHAGAQVRQFPVTDPGNRGLFWRFRVANDPDVDRFLCRDCDSPLSVRERVAVEAWLASDACFHVMRDHLTHTALMLAGLWGGVAGLLPDMIALEEKYTSTRGDRWTDQVMLAEQIWPRIRDNTLIHDSHFSIARTETYPRYGTLPPPLHAGYSRKRRKKSHSSPQEG